MCKPVIGNIKKIQLNSDLYQLHKNGTGKNAFGMDNSSELLNGGFGLYSTINLKKNIGPIKTDYFRIGLVRKGNATFEIGFEKYLANRNCIVFGIPEQIFSLNNISKDFFAYYLLFSELFIADVLFKLNKNQHFPFLTYSGFQCFEVSNDSANEIESLIFKINVEIKRNKTECIEVICLYIQLILIHANRNYRALLLTQHNTSNTLQNLFYSYSKLVSQHFLTVRKVADYAKKLHVSPDHLNRAVKCSSNKTAHELIDEMILMEAKSYLLYSNMTVSEIAYKLEFADPSHFIRFFKKNCNITPVEFRKKS